MLSPKDAGPLRAIINNASVLVYEPIEAVTEETLDRMLSAGLKSVFWGVQAFLANRDEGVTGSILNYSSPVAYRGRPNTGAYTTIKAGIAGLTKVLAGELGPRGVRVNAIAPGSCADARDRGLRDARSNMKQRAKSIPLRRNGTVDGRGAGRGLPAQRRGERSSTARCWRWTAGSLRRDDGAQPPICPS